MLDVTPISQILITDEGSSSKLPEVIQQNVRSIKSLYPNSTYRLFSRDCIRELMKANFEANVLEAFDGLRPYAFKADLARYCILFLFGGIYVDLSIRLLHKLRVGSGKGLVCFRDVCGLWGVANGLIYAEAGRREMSEAILGVVKNFSRRHYGASPLHPSGPALFGRVLATNDCEEEIEIGSFQSLTGNNHPANYGFVDSSGRIIALRMKTSSLSDLGVDGANNYGEIWSARQVYGERQICFYARSLHVVESDHNHVQRTSQGISFSGEVSGCIVFGPHQYINPGRYRATYFLSSKASLVGLSIDVLIGDHGLFEVSERKDVCEADKDAVIIDFSLSKRLLYQVRLASVGGVSGTVLRLEIEPLD